MKPHFFRSLSFQLSKLQRWPYYLFLIIAIWVIYPSCAAAQTLSTEALIEAWKVSDTSQTTRAEATYQDLRQHYHNPTLFARFKELDAYVAQHPDIRLKARVMMYKMQGKPENVTPNELWATIRQTGVLGDEQLMSELYAKYAELKAPDEKKSYYLLKAIQLQERIGTEHFKNIYFRYLTLSGWLYRTSDYTHSLYYGLKALQSFNPKENFILDYFFTLDIIGASYKELNNADSAMYYYQKLEHVIADYQSAPNRYSKVSHIDARLITIWQGIARGGIAQALVLKHDYEKAYPLLLQNLAISLKHQEWDDAATVQNIIADINYTKKQYPLALTQYRSARNYCLRPKQSYNIRARINSAKGMADVFSKLNHFDSAYVYQREYTHLKDSLQRRTDAIQFATANTAVEYDAMQNAFSKAQEENLQQKRLRNVLLSGVAVATVIALLLYNRKRLNYRIQQQKLEREQQLAQIEIAHAREQLQAFTRNIAEKNKLIEELQQRYSGSNDASGHSFDRISLLTDDDWVSFKAMFDKVYPNFFAHIKKTMPDLSAAEYRFLALGKLEMPTKEMAVAQGITVEAVRKQRHRMRKKLEQFSPEMELETLIAKA